MTPFENSGSQVIQLKIQTLDDLFERLDPSPMAQRDLAQSVHEYLSEQLARSPGNCPAMVSLEAPRELGLDQAIVETAARTHFAREAGAKRLEVARIFRKGFVLMATAIVFGLLLVILAQWIAGISDTRLAERVANALSILVWIVVWRPAETLIYDWRPVRETAHLYKRLSQMTLRVSEYEEV
jgi:hypothetical protein